jgi:hypothetical protein
MLRWFQRTKQLKIENNGYGTRAKVCSVLTKELKMDKTNFALEEAVFSLNNNYWNLSLSYVLVH